LLEHPDASLPPRAEIASVPFFAQEDYQCGPAALAMALSYAGKTVTPDALVEQVYVPDRQGSLQAEMLATARRQGMVAHRLAPQLADLLGEVAAGTPVIVLENLAFGFAPLWHYAVVVGYDVGREEVVLRSGVTPRLVMTMSNFERVWARSGYWAMAAYPPGKLPAGGSGDQFVPSIAALERVDPAAARTAYAAVLARTPDHLLARIGLGNASYALHDLPAAESAYRRATELHPDSADAWNNLAQALLELRRRAEARSAAERAVQLGGPRAATYRDTLRAIAESPE
jgi:hypothetical protein